MVGLPSFEVICVNVIFNLNGVFITIRFHSSQMGLVSQHKRPPIVGQIVVLKLGLKQLLDRCMV
jgi:hypothetical protein